ncbi:hypothetical protein [Scopulibacillus darangshiensis]|uniref:hypothetical protein n=1 Tax=Scopulibacillus darangshiensis TaxID=442528 RepID=UPI001045E562|nr:hypothetical protein [Scopulibacillus darangshiensis]
MGKDSDVYVQINAININVLSNCAGVFSGSNNQPLWSSNSKNNMGFGREFGNSNSSISIINAVFDNDMEDLTIWKKSGAGKGDNGEEGTS